MTQEEFVSLLRRLLENGLGVHEDVAMVDGDQPEVDEYGQQVYRDVVQVGDGRLYIQRDDNEVQAEQDVIDFLAGIEAYLPEIIQALEDR